MSIVYFISALWVAIVGVVAAIEGEILESVLFLNSSMIILILARLESRDE